MSDITTGELPPRSKFIIELAASVAAREQDPEDLPDAEFRELGAGWSIVGQNAVTSLLAESFFLAKRNIDATYGKADYVESRVRKQVLEEVEDAINDSGLYNFKKYKIKQLALKRFHHGEGSGLPKGYLINKVQGSSASPEDTLALLAVTLRHRLHVSFADSPDWPSWGEIWDAVQAGPNVYPAISSGLVDMREDELKDRVSVHSRLEDVLKITRYTAAAIHENSRRSSRYHSFGRSALRFARRRVN